MKYCILSFRELSDVKAFKTEMWKIHILKHFYFWDMRFVLTALLPRRVYLENQLFGHKHINPEALKWQSAVNSLSAILMMYAHCERKSETLMVALNTLRISIWGPIGTNLRSWEMFSMFSMFSWEKQIWGKAGIRAVTAATWAPTTITR